MSDRQRKLSPILADYVSPSTSSAKRLQLKAKLKQMYPVYKGNYKCKGDANRFIANVGGKWKYWYQVFPLGFSLRTGSIPYGTRDSFHRTGNRWYLYTMYEVRVRVAGKPATTFVSLPVELKTGMVIGTAEKRTSIRKWKYMHHWVWLGGMGSQPEFIDGLSSQKIRTLHPSFRFWGGDFFIVIRVFDPFDPRSK